MKCSHWGKNTRFYQGHLGVSDYRYFTITGHVGYSILVRFRTIAIRKNGLRTGNTLQGLLPFFPIYQKNNQADDEYDQNEEQVIKSLRRRGTFLRFDVHGRFTSKARSRSSVMSRLRKTNNAFYLRVCRRHNELLVNISCCRRPIGIEWRRNRDEHLVRRSATI